MEDYNNAPGEVARGNPWGLYERESVSLGFGNACLEGNLDSVSLGMPGAALRQSSQSPFPRTTRSHFEKDRLKKGDDSAPNEALFVPNAFPPDIEV